MIKMLNNRERYRAYILQYIFAILSCISYPHAGARQPFSYTQDLQSHLLVPQNEIENTSHRNKSAT